jgi:lysyl-tRNA synthetase class 2
MYRFDSSWLEKLAAMRAAGLEPFPSANGMVVTHTSGALHAACPEGVDPATVDIGAIAVGGRVMFRNVMGKAMFLRVQDRAGVIQLYARREQVGEPVFDVLKGIDIGDFVWAKGALMRTRTGELSIQLSEARLASKIMTPFPDRFHAVTDVETRSRQRYVDLFINPDARDVFKRRSAIVRFMRDFFQARDFLEVETPMMQVIPGGASARPFVTHHNALDIDLYLRVAPELYLKRLVVGGLERVFEINRNFRNEGISQRHNPEFTMLEFYQAWATYHDLMTLTEALLSELAARVTGAMVVPFGEWKLDFTPPFRRADMDELIAEATGLSRDTLRDPVRIEAFWRANHRVGAGEPLPSTFGKWWEKLFEEYVEKSLINPTFVTGFPAEISPLARRSDGDPERTDRFELYVATWEIANAFTELNDPVDQAGRFAAQAKARDAGDAESMYFDADYVRALTYGMPPTAGEGIGVDRLTMLLTGKASIREVILFPTLRPEKREDEAPPAATE